MAGRVQGGNTEHVVVDLHIGQHDIGHVADEQIVLPVRSPRFPPEDPIRDRASRCHPPDIGVVTRGRARDERLTALVDDHGRRRRQRERGGCRGVHARVLGEIWQRDAFERVAHVVLPCEVLPRLAEADGGEPKLVVRGMITAPPEPIGSRQRPDLVRRDVPAAPALNEPGQRARRRILGAFCVDADGRAVDDPVASPVVAHDVVVEHRLDGNVRGGRLLRVQPGADQALFLARMAHEHERGVEVQSALTERPRELDRQRGAAPIVIHAGRQVVDGCIGIGGRWPRSVRIARRTSGIGRTLPARTRDRIVVTADVNSSWSAAREDRHHVPQLDIVRDPPLLRHVIGIEADLELRAVALHLVENPLARGADAARR